MSRCWFQFTIVQHSKSPYPSMEIRLNHSKDKGTKLLQEQQWTKADRFMRGSDKVKTWADLLQAWSSNGEKLFISVGSICPKAHKAINNKTNEQHKHCTRMPNPESSNPKAGFVLQLVSPHWPLRWQQDLLLGHAKSTLESKKQRWNMTLIILIAVCLSAVLQSTTVMYCKNARCNSKMW